MIRPLLAIAVALGFAIPVHAEEPADVLAASTEAMKAMARNADLFLRYNGERKLKRGAISALTEKLRDPDSVNFRDIRVVQYADGHVVCGEFNAKNAFGGYVGYQVFAGSYSHVRTPRTYSDPQIEAAANAPLYEACGR